MNPLPRLNHELKFETASSKSLRSRKEVPRNTDLTATRIVSHTIPNCTVIVTAFPDEHVETVGYTEVKPEMLDTLALHQPKPTADSLAEFAKLAESGTITRSQFETFAYHAVNSPLPNENFTDLNALADTLRKALDEGTQIIL